MVMYMKIIDRYNYYSINLMKNKFNYKNIMEIPKIKKITLNMGLGKSILDKTYLKSALENLSIICGQKPIVCKAKKSISSFKLRKGWPIGCKVTLRNIKMYNFLDKLIFIAIPRIKDFNGLNKLSFDRYGNFSFGIKDQIIFPEINYYNNNYTLGLDICININSNSNVESLELLKSLYFPFR